MARESALKRSDVIPMTYWKRTRADGTHLLSQMLAWPVLLLVVLLYSTGGRISMEVVHFTSAWMAFLSLYELGYFMNDFWSQPREIRRGIRQHRQFPRLQAEERWVLLAAIAARVASFIVIGISLHFACGEGVAASLVVVTGGTLVVFALHNVIFTPFRVATLVGLHVGKIALICPFVHGLALPWTLAMTVIVPPVMFGISYGVNKNVFLPSLRPVTTNINFQLGLSSLTWLVLGTVGWLAGLDGMGLLALLAAYAALCSLVMTAMRVAKACRGMISRRDDCYHVHTCYSHDCDLSLEAVRKHAAEAGYQRVFIADHAETFDAEKYSRLLQECRMHNSLDDGLPELIPGLEYPVNTQHILAIGLSSYVRIDENGVDAIRALERCCREVIWAHPHFAIRRMLFEPRYRRQYFAMISSVRRFEAINHKSLRGLHYRWRHWAVAIVAMYFFGGKDIYVGVDAHATEDWEQAVAGRTREAEIKAAA